MKVKNVTIVGVGALGSHFLQIVRNVNASYKIVDFDRVEQKNCSSQFHAKSTVGKSKVVGLQQTVNFLWGMRVGVNSNKLVQENVEQVLGGSDLIVDCLDNGAGRRLVQNFVRKNSVPCLHGGLAAEAAFAQVMWDENFTIDDEPSIAAPTCENGEHLPFIIVTAALMARSAQGFLEQGKKFGFHVRPNGVVQI